MFIFHPMQALFRRLPLWAKLSLAMVVVVIGVAGLATSWYRGLTADIDFTAKEHVGVEYAQALIPLLVTAHERTSDPAAPVNLAAVSELQDRFGATLSTDDAWKGLQAAAQKGELHTPLQTLLSAIADGSNLTLDPDLDSYYLMDTVMWRARLRRYPTLYERRPVSSMVRQSQPEDPGSW